MQRKSWSKTVAALPVWERSWTERFLLERQHVPALGAAPAAAAPGPLSPCTHLGEGAREQPVVPGVLQQQHLFPRCTLFLKRLCSTLHLRPFFFLFFFFFPACAAFGEALRGGRRFPGRTLLQLHASAGCRALCTRSSIVSILTAGRLHAY